MKNIIDYEKEIHALEDKFEPNSIKSKRIYSLMKDILGNEDLSFTGCNSLLTQLTQLLP